MKTVLKRLLSFVLVAMMLVSAVPFQASAAADDVITIVVYGMVGKATTPAYQDTYGVTEDADGKYLYSPADLIALVDGQCGNVGDLIHLNVTGDKTNYTDESTDEVELKKTNEKTIGAWVYYNDPDPVPSSVEYKVYLVDGANKDTKLNGTDGYESSWDDVDKVTAQDITDAIAAAKAELVSNDEKYGVEGDYTFDTVSATVKKNGSTQSVPFDVTEDMTDENTIIITVPVYKEYTVTLMNGDETFQVLRTVKSKLKDADFQIIPDDKTFDHWDAASAGWSGTELEDLKGVTLKKDYTFYAYYNDTTATNPDKKSDLKVVAKYYVDGREKDSETIYVIEDLLDGSNVYDVLKANQEEINNAVNDAGWGAWIDGKFYENNLGSKEITSKDTMKGERTVYVMVGSKGALKVQLHVHVTTTSQDGDYIINLFGYDANDTLKRADIREALTKKWPNRTYSFDGMYTTKGWTDIRGKKTGVTALTSFPLSDEDAYDAFNTANVHIYAKLVESQADDSNPKTGDAIMMAMTVLGISASALAALYFLNKKRQAM